MVNVVDCVFVPAVEVEGKELQCQECHRKSNRHVKYRHEMICTRLKRGFANNFVQEFNEDEAIEMTTMGVMTVHNDDERRLETASNGNANQYYDDNAKQSLLPCGKKRIISMKLSDFATHAGLHPVKYCV